MGENVKSYKLIKACEFLYECNSCERNCLNYLNSFINHFDYIIVDLSNLTAINSCMLSKIITNNSKIIVCNVSDISSIIIDSLGVKRVVKIFETLEDAIRYVESLEDIEPINK